MNKEIIFERINLAVDNMIRSQIIDRLDANSGRTLRDYNARTGMKVYSGNWCTGIFMACLLAMYKRTGKAEYLDRAEHAGHYIMSLQYLDSRDQRHYGMFRETTPQSEECLPRDAVTAAWCLVWLYEATGKAEYLDRAILFAEWHLKYGMTDGWPLYAVFTAPTNTNYYTKGSFQSGTGLFYYDLFLHTDDPRYIEFGLKPIADQYIEKFFREDGGIICEIGIFNGKEQIRTSKDSVELAMHAFNDDFGNQMLMAASDLFEDDKYRAQARKFAHWLVRHQSADGNFFNGVKYVTSAVPQALMYFDELGRYYNDQVLLDAAERTFKKLLDMQILESDDPCLYGAFEGMPYSSEDDPRRCTQARTNAYSIISLFKVEGRIKDFWLGGEHNKKFIDPIFVYNAQNPYPFKY
ncbi:MAG: hypothetical protein E7052_06215 [Lentisphaerae bacterium]|nr:hypothetical protein [Lentisphaerota bacterium]